MPEIQELIAHPRVIEVLDQASFTENAITTLEKRYLLRDEIGNFRETVPELFVRVAWNISEAELRNGESPEHRFEVFLKFLEIMIRREFMPNSPTLFNAGTPSQMLSACFPAGTSITTMDGPMAIEDVRLGDRVLTHEGRYRRVTETMNRYGQLWRVKVDKLPEMLVTEEHPILTQRGWVAVKDLRPKSDFVAIGRVTERESTPSVIQVAGLTVDGYVYQPRVGVASQAGSVVSQQVKPVKAAVQIDEDISWLLGMYISQGSISAGYDLRFALSTDKPEQATKLSSILEERFGLAVSVVHTEREDTGYRWTTVRIHSKLFVNWIQEHFGSGFNQKLLPSWFMKQPIRVLSAFLRGVADGDGTPVNRYQTRITLSNEPLVRQLFDVAVTLGYSPSLRKEYLPPHATAQPWAMTYGPIYHSAMVRDGYYRVKAIAPTGEVAAVYNFEVEEDHSYVANQVVVHNCFVMPIDDSIEDIYTTLKHTAHVHRAGGGTGFSFSNLRESGAFVSTTSGTASGPIDFLRLYDASTNAVKQGGKRRGANMAILRVDHPDILDFITCKQDTSQITNFNISVAITREFMQALQNGCSYPIRDPRDRNKIRYYLDARAVWQLIVHSAWTTGEPGLFFIDRANDTNPMPHVSEIEATNPCVTGDTRIATQYGLLSAKELHKRHLPILATVDASVTGEGGIEVQPATPVEQTAELADIFQVKTKQGYQLRLTANHKVPTKRGVVPAGELRKGDKLFLQSGEGQWGEEGDFRLGFLIGAFQADGHFDNERGAILDLHGHKIEAADQILEWANDLVRGTALGYRPEYELTAVPAKGGTRSTITSIRLARLFAELGFGRTTKHQVPEAVWRGNREMVRGYLQALFSFDGSVQGSRQTGVTIRLAQSDLKLLSDVQILLANFGKIGRAHV